MTHTLLLIDSGNTAWMLTSTMLVLLMSIPGIALFYGGLVRQKNVFGAFLIGIITSAICFCMVAVAKPRFGYDDSLDAFGVHGVGGIVGSVLTGVFATRAITGEDGVQGALYGDWHQLLVQVIATLFSIAFSAAVTFILFKATDATVGLRVDKRMEEEGLDIYEHGESAYNH